MKATSQQLFSIFCLTLLTSFPSLYAMESQETPQQEGPLTLNETLRSAVYREPLKNVLHYLNLGANPDVPDENGKTVRAAILAMSEQPPTPKTPNDPHLSAMCFPSYRATHEKEVVKADISDWLTTHPINTSLPRGTTNESLEGTSSR